jgi:L-fuculose-phosphate aldolase
VYEGIRKTVADLAVRMLEMSLTDGTSGNVSAIDRASGAVAITPSAVPYEGMTADMIPVVDLCGARLWGDRKPSSELPMHLAAYEARPDAAIVLHTHSRYAIAVACTNTDLPAITVDMAAYCGSAAKLVPYNTPGSAELARAVASMFSQGHRALLLANHGTLLVAPDAQIGIEAAEALELNAMAYVRSSVIGRPVPIPSEEVQKLLALVYGEEQRAV